MYGIQRTKSNANDVVTITQSRSQSVARQMMVRLNGLRTSTRAVFVATVVADWSDWLQKLIPKMSKDPMTMRRAFFTNQTFRDEKLG
jgi:hypothetical protein